ncbi:MAG TPA: hypothetical protein VGM88_23530 [Kofleriaceae bacterium]|jgi:hypothetical protein
MKLDVRDVGALAALAPVDLSAYLRARGWVGRVENGGSLFAKQIDGETVEIDAPIKREVRDYALRVADLLENLAIVERRGTLEIYQDIARARRDVIRVSVDVPDAGRVGLDEASTLVNSTRDLVLAAACSTYSPRAYFPRRKPARAMEFVRDVKVAAPEAGSFVVVLESPVEPTAPELIPFAREAIVMLATAGEQVRRAVDASVVSGTVDGFADVVKHGVNGNYCDALAALLEEGGGRDVTLSFTWAPVQPLAVAAPDRLKFRRSEAAQLRTAASFLKSYEPVRGFEVVGPIVKLGGSVETGGFVTVYGALDVGQRHVTVELDATSYSDAVEAHLHDRTVSVEGDLVREGRSYRLLQPRAFAVITTSTL